jgi:hypothetical protein
MCSWVPCSKLSSLQKAIALVVGLVSAKLAVSQWDIKAQYGASDIVNEAATTVSVGADYNFTKKFQFISYITSEESDEGMDDTYIGAGAILKF